MRGRGGRKGEVRGIEGREATLRYVRFLCSTHSAIYV